jgi:hypothetical protein
VVLLAGSLDVLGCCAWAWGCGGGTSPAFFSASLPGWALATGALAVTSSLKSGFRKRPGTPRAADEVPPTQAPSSWLQRYSPRWRR